MTAYGNRKKPSRRRRAKTLPATAAEREIISTLLGKNIPPHSQSQDPRVQRRLRRQAEDWLRKNDPRHYSDQVRAQRQQLRDQRQAEKNPSLINDRRKALGLRP